MDLFKEPGHVLPQNLHGPNAFFIGCHIADFSTDAQIPVNGTRDDHLADGEKVVDVNKINNLKKIDDTSKDVPKQEIKLDMNATEALGNLLDINKEDTRDSDITNFLNEKADNQDVIKKDDNVS